MCCTRLAENTGHKKSLFWHHHTTLYCDQYVCLCVCLPACPRWYLRNHTRDRYQIFVGVAYVRGSVPRHVDDRLHRLLVARGWWECTVQAMCNLWLPCFSCLLVVIELLVTGCWWLCLHCILRSEAALSWPWHTDDSGRQQSAGRRSYWTCEQGQESCTASTRSAAPRDVSTWTEMADSHHHERT